MGKFLIRVLLFLLPVLVLAWPLDRFLSSHLLRSHDRPGELEVWKDIYSGELKADIAIYGSSRAWVHVDPRILQDTLGVSAYNFGIDGHFFPMVYLRHLEYLKHNTPPSTIIFSFDAFSLEDREDLYNKEQFLPFMWLNDTVRKYTSKYKGFNVYDYCLPLVRYSGAYNAKRDALGTLFSAQDSDGYRNKGFKGFDLAWTNDFANAAAEGEIEIKPHKAVVSLFKQFILDCKWRNIKLVLVYSPEYAGTRNIVSNRSAMITLFRNYARVYDLPFLDYSEHPLCYDRANFYNNSHLNAKAAAQFSSRLAHDLRTLKP